MSRRDKLHFPVRRALEKDGWTITDDELKLEYEGVLLSADLGAERFAAERGLEKIAVEVKDFSHFSAASELEKAIGQLFIYQLALRASEPDRGLFLAVSSAVYNAKFQTRFFQAVIGQARISLLVIDAEEEVVKQWIRHLPTP